MKAAKKSKKAGRRISKRISKRISSSAKNAKIAEGRKYSGSSTVERVERTEADRMKNGHLDVLETSAADRFYEYYVGVQLSGRGIEIKERVDTSGANFQIPDRVIHCQKKLAEAARHLGMVDYTIVHKYICEGKTTVQICTEFNREPTDRQKLYFRKRYRDACAILGNLWFPPKGKKTVHETDNPKLDFAEYLKHDKG